MKIKKFNENDSMELEIIKKIFSPIKNRKRLKTIDKLLRNEKYFSKSGDSGVWYSETVEFRLFDLEGNIIKK